MQVRSKPFLSSRKRETDARGERGFSLPETCVALVLMMIVGLGVVSVFSYAINNNTGAGDRALALALAQQRMERLRNVTFTDASLTATAAAGTTETVSVSVGTRPDGSAINRMFTVWTRIDNTTTTLKTIQIQVTPRDDSGAWARGSVLLTTQRSAAVTGPNYGG